MFKNQLSAFTIAAVLTSFAAFAQEDYTRFKSEASVQALGSFVKQTTENGVDQGATDSAGVLATYRYYYNRPTASRRTIHGNQIHKLTRDLAWILIRMKSRRPTFSVFP